MISDIASTSVVQVDVTSSIADALDVMLVNNHRNVIVVSSGCYKILTIVDVLNIQKKHLNLEMPLSKLELSKVPEISRYKNVLDTLEYLNDSTEYLCVVNPDKTLYGLVTHTDITSNIDPDTLMDNYKLTDFLKLGRRMKWVSKETLTSVLLQEMVNGSFDNIVVVEKMKPVGILTTKDVMRMIKQKDDLEVPISYYMSTPVETIHKESSIKDALQFVRKKHYKRVIVTDDNGNLSGIITQKELIYLTYSRW